MIVSLEDTFHSEFLFLPARKRDGKLLGLEILVNFVSSDNRVQAPAELVIPRLTPEESLALFCEQLALLESCQLFFSQQQLIAWVNIYPQIVNALITDDQLAARVSQFPFLELTLNENYPDLNSANKNNSLVLLTNKYPLMLTNFGAGAASLKAIFDGLFKRISLDKNFVQQRLLSQTFEPFMRAIVSQVEPYCRGIIITGIDSQQAMDRAVPFNFSAMQGALWPAVPPALLTTLVQL